MEDPTAGRISFFPETDTMEADFSDLELRDQEDVGRFYDGIESKISQSGRTKWFFLVNYRNCRIMPSAWLAHSQRGKRLNLTHSLGSVRFDASPETQAEIKRRAGTDAFDANLFDNRQSAVERIAELRAAMPSWRQQRPTPSQYTEAEFERRLSFLDADQIMDVDFSDFDFDRSADVNAFYDHIEGRIAQSGQHKWYFLVNYHRCKISLRAWIAYTQRGKRLNINHSLGSVRYGVDLETEREIRGQADRMGFPANIFPTREAALGGIDDLKRQSH